MTKVQPSNDDETEEQTKCSTDNMRSSISSEDRKEDSRVDRKREREIEGYSTKANDTNSIGKSISLEEEQRSATTKENAPVQSETKKSKYYPLHVEAIIHPICPTQVSLLRIEIERYILSIGQSSFMYTAGPVDLTSAPNILQTSCLQISIVDIESPPEENSTSNIKNKKHSIVQSIASWNISTIKVHAYTLSDEEAEAEELDNHEEGDENLTACETLPLPHSSLHTSWENLILPTCIKHNLLGYAHSALLFTDAKVSPHIISWNRVILLHGPPGTGKTTLCRALAHKLCIRMNDRFPNGGYLLEIHAHSLFSKWFSESGKLVSKLFLRIREMVEDEPEGLFCLLVDEVESLAASRIGNKTGGGGEPSDAIRAVNSLLTSIDQLKRYKNVIVLTTTNITGSVDVAFVDRADMKQYIGLPCVEARYEILRSCVEELLRVGILVRLGMNENDSPNKENVHLSGSNLVSLRSYDDALNLKQNGCKDVIESPELDLLDCAELAKGLSGRSLRKLPFQSHAFHLRCSEPVLLRSFFVALRKQVLATHSSVESVMKQSLSGNE